MHTKYHITLKSSNAKTGPIPVTTTEQKSCPDICPFRNDEGCYAETGPLALHWRKVSTGERSINLDQLCNAISGLVKGQLWRHNQAGDLPHNDGIIDAEQVSAIVRSNQGRKGFTYTHHDMNHAHNRAVIQNANESGFTINLSGNDLGHADQLAALSIAPVTVVLPHTVQGNAKITTPAGRKVTVCPATYRDDISCATCKLCASAKQERPIIGFPAHGTRKAKASAIAIAIR